MGKGGKILVADDSVVMQNVLKKILLGIGCRDVRTVANGQAAWELLESERDFELVFADLRMPRLSGLGLLDRIRQSSTMQALPVVIISSEADPASILEAGKHNATAYVVKPFSVEKISGVIKSILGR
jgi:two-component system chemotaxis response regulator CheY